MKDESKIEAMVVLEPLIKDCEKLSREPDLSNRTRSDIFQNLREWNSAIGHSELSVSDLYGLIESVYGLIGNAKKQCPKFDDRYPSNLTHLEAGYSLVFNRKGTFVLPGGKTAIKIDLDL